MEDLARGHAEDHQGVVVNAGNDHGGQASEKHESAGNQQADAQSRVGDRQAVLVLGHRGLALEQLAFSGQAREGLAQLVQQAAGNDGDHIA